MALISNQHFDVEQAQAMYGGLGFTVHSYEDRGAFKFVFRADFQGQDVALKVIVLDDDISERGVEQRRRNEVTAMAKISSPYVARLIYAGGWSMDHHPYIVEEFIDGPTLKSLIADRSISLTRSLEILDNLFCALISCANERIVHRDVKPGNIRIRPTGEAVLLDFGLARPIDVSTLTSTGQVIGTLLYSPPELLVYDRNKNGQRTDLFSLGVIAFEMLTGRHPFVPDLRGLDESDVYALMQRAEAPRAAEVAPHLDEELCDLLDVLIRREYNARIPTIARAYEAFKDYKARRK